MNIYVDCPFQNGVLIFMRIVRGKIDMPLILIVKMFYFIGC